MVTQLIIISGLDLFTFILSMTMFTPYILSLKASVSFLGTINSISSLVALFWNPIAGSLSDAKGRKRLLLQCIILNIIGTLVLIPIKSLTSIFISRMITSLAVPSQILIKALITDLAKDNEEKSAALNKLGMSFSVCFLLGAILSSFLMEFENGFTIIFSIMLLNQIVAFALTYYTIPDDTKVQKDQEQLTVFKGVYNHLKTTTNNIKALNWKKYWDIFAVKFSLDFTLCTVQNSLGLILVQVFGFSNSSIGYSLLFSSIVGIFANVFILQMKKSLYKDDKEGFLKILHGIGLLFITYFGMGLSPVFPIFCIFIFTWAFGRTLLDTTLADVLTNRADESEKGCVISLFDSSFFLSGAIAPIYLGLVADSYGLQIPVLLCIFPTSLAAYIVLKQNSKNKTK